jgi:glycosyltransferase involved in cell wall biosynthesis
MYTRSALAARALGVPLVVKLAGDPVYERSRRLGLFDGLRRSSKRPQTPLVRVLRRVRAFALDAAVRIIIPSRYLADIAGGWGLHGDRIAVVTNPAPEVDVTESRVALRQRLGIAEPTFVFAGRLAGTKNLALAIAALERTDQGPLVIIGDGPEEPALRARIAASSVADRVEMKGAMPRALVLEWLRAGDAAILSSNWENHPHAEVEALACGAPVVATAVGGVPEIVRDGENGLLVPRRDAEALASALTALGSDRELAARLRDGAAATEPVTAAQAFAAIELALERAAADE